MTNFFEHQAAARRKTGLLVIYFIAAVLGLILAVYLLFTAVFAFPDIKQGEVPTVWVPTRLAGVTGGVIMLVGGCSLYKVLSLSGGGRSVALLLGAREVSGSTRVAAERRLLNIVEEMSIASGVPMPAVYVMDDEEGINAFAAGYSTDDAVVAVSRGALDYLTRDEIQGVIAHEFSHILNGDMRLNIRLMGIIFGILALALIGEILMRSRSSSKKGGQIALFGIGLFLIGLIGAFFGNLIKAAVSRQREYLADASAVQFTRNPDGIGGALQKIGGLEKGPNMDHPNAPEASHMFFGDAQMAKRIAGMFATHPPLEDRIRRVLPHWDGEYPKVRRLGDRDAEERKPRKQPPPLPGVQTLPGMPQVPIPILVEEMVNRTGTITPEQTTYAAAIRDSIPDPLREAVEEPFGARAAIYCLLLDPNAAIRDRQFERLKAESEPPDYQETVRLSRSMRDLPDAARLPLIDIATPALRRMSPAQYDVFRRQISHLTMADDCVDTFEFVLRCVLDRHLDANFGLAKRPQAMSREVKIRHVATVLSLLAREGHDDEGAARKAYEAGTRHFLRAGDAPPILPPTECGLVQLEEALQALSGASIGGKRRLLLACAECIAADRQTTVREAELYRAIGEVLGCPIPPLAAPAAKSQ
jgi:Zn-dependent protease with chaperone function